MLSVSHSKKIIQLSCIAFFLTLVGCSHDDFTDLDKYIAKVKAKPKGSIEPLPKRKSIEAFAFTPDKVRDPFRLLDQAKVDESANLPVINNGIKPDMNRRREELEAFPLDTLKMVGTMVVKSTLWGLVQNREHNVYRVRVGNYLGKNYGKITRIDTDKIELLEMISDKPGSWSERQASVTLVEENRKAKKQSGGKK